MNCAVCKAPAAAFCCSRCELVAYCGASCQDADWKQRHWADHDDNEAISPVLPGLYVGSLEALCNPDLLRRYRIGAVVTALHRDSYHNLDKMLARLVANASEVAGTQLKHLLVSIHDSEDAPIERYFDKVADFIDSNRSKGVSVLVHCAAGVSRSVSLVIYYMLKHVPEFDTVKQALKHIRRTRPWPFDADGAAAAPFLVPVDVANKCETLKILIEDVGADTVIPLPPVSSKALAKVIEYCQLGEGEASLFAPPEDQPALFELLTAANYLDVKPLLTLLCNAVADMVKGKTPEEVCAVFNVPKDTVMTPEQEEQMRVENADWCMER